VPRVVCEHRLVHMHPRVAEVRDTACEANPVGVTTEYAFLVACNGVVKAVLRAAQERAINPLETCLERFRAVASFVGGEPVKHELVYWALHICRLTLTAKKSQVVLCPKNSVTALPLSFCGVGVP